MSVAEPAGNASVGLGLSAAAVRVPVQAAVPTPAACPVRALHLSAPHAQQPRVLAAAE